MNYLTKQQKKYNFCYFSKLEVGNLLNSKLRNSNTNLCVNYVSQKELGRIYSVFIINEINITQLLTPFVTSSKKNPPNDVKQTEPFKGGVTEHRLKSLNEKRRFRFWPVEIEIPLSNTLRSKEQN